MTDETLDTGSEDNPRDRRQGATPQAASRARRVAGRPRPTARPRPQTDTEPAETEPAVTLEKTVEEERPAKPGRAREPKPARERPAKAAPEPRSGLSWLPAILLTLLACLLTALLVFLLLADRDEPAGGEDRQRMLSSAKQAMALITSYDYRRLEADQAAAVAHLTTEFRTKYETSMNTAIKPEAVKQKAVVVGQVNHAALQSVAEDGNHASLLVFGQLNVTNLANPQTRSDIFSAVVDVEKVDGRWLVSRILQV